MGNENVASPTQFQCIQDITSRNHRSDRHLALVGNFCVSSEFLRDDVGTLDNSGIDAGSSDHFGEAVGDPASLLVRCLSDHFLCQLHSLLQVTILRCLGSAKCRFEAENLQR